jgi:hypothetical protein
MSWEDAQRASSTTMSACHLSLFETLTVAVDRETPFARKGSGMISGGYSLSRVSAKPPRHVVLTMVPDPSSSQTLHCR